MSAESATMTAANVVLMACSRGIKSSRSMPPDISPHAPL
jgi:hypothetical protein